VSAYYNEIDPFAAAWLRELIADGQIAPGEVDERSIEDVLPSDLAGFVQCHFFAGIGVWSLALRQAGWPDDGPIWTGSCPCQPFSAAGKGGGFADERHLWPAFHWLIEQCGPELVLGEQVASKDGLAWLDLVSADVEASGYAFGAADTCAAGFGAPHIRQRLYWMADALCRGTQHAPGEGLGAQAPADGIHGCLPGQRRGLGIEGSAIRVAGADRAGLEGRQAELECADQRSVGSRSMGDRLADPDGGNTGAERQQRSGEQRQQPQDGGAGGVGHAVHPERRPFAEGWGNEPDRRDSRWKEAPSGQLLACQDVRPGPLNGLWRDADWLCCTDGKWRPVAPGSFPLAPAGTVRNRVGLLRGAGNAINLAQAQGFIEAVMEVRCAERLAA
jgi:DNA (cytosine-5)-methyltransferase 1